MDRLTYHIALLSDAIQKQVMDFVEFLLTKHRKEQAKQREENKYPFRGSVIFYDNPFEPVAEDDLEALA